MGLQGVSSPERTAVARMAQGINDGNPRNTGRSPEPPLAATLAENREFKAQTSAARQYDYNEGSLIGHICH